jgi:hypothetical protein
MIIDATKSFTKWRYGIGLFLLVIILLSYFPLTVYAYDVDTHYYLKYYLLRKVGFTPEEAKIIAKADQSTDFGDTEAGFAYKNNNPKWHALASETENDARETELWNRAINALGGGGTLEQKLIPFGQFLHFLEDRTPHEGFGWFFGHAFKGHEVDYLSYHDLDTIQAEVETWLLYMQFFQLCRGLPPNPVEWNDVKDTVGKVRDANPTPRFWSSPDGSKAKDVINKALKEEIDPNESISAQTNYRFDKNGNLIGMIPFQKFSFTSEALARNNATIMDAIEVIENSPYFPSHPEAAFAIQWLLTFLEEQDAVDPSINSLGYAISYMIGLSQEDAHVLNETMHVSLLMHDFAFTRELHVLYLRSVRGCLGAGIHMEEAYDAIAQAEPEIIKMETNPADVNFDLLGGSLEEAWWHIREAELDALTLGDLGGGIPPQFFNYDGKVDGKDFVLFLQVFKGLAPAEAKYLGDLGGGVPPAFFNFDGKCDGKDLALFLKCFKGLGP